MAAIIATMQASYQASVLMPDPKYSHIDEMINDAVSSRYSSTPRIYEDDIYMANKDTSESWRHNSYTPYREESSTEMSSTVGDSHYSSIVQDDDDYLTTTKEFVTVSKIASFRQ